MPTRNARFRAVRASPGEASSGASTPHPRACRISFGCERRWTHSRRSSIATLPSRRRREAQSTGAPAALVFTSGLAIPLASMLHTHATLPRVLRSSGAMAAKAAPAKAAVGPAAGPSASASAGTATGLPPPPTLGVAAPADGSALMSYVSSGSGSGSRPVPDGTCAVRPEVVSVRVVSFEGYAVRNGG